MQGIAFFHNGRLLGKLSQSEGQIEVNPKLFGTGHVSLRAIGLSRKGATDFVHSRPVELDVHSTRPLPALKQPEFAKLQNGLLLKLASGRSVPVEESFSADWLDEAGVKPGGNFELDGYFQVPRTEIYQFQVWHTGQLKLAIDGQTIYEGSEGNYRQRFAPVASPPTCITCRSAATRPVGASCGFCSAARGRGGWTGPRFATWAIESLAGTRTNSGPTGISQAGKQKRPRGVEPARPLGFF